MSSITLIAKDIQPTDFKFHEVDFILKNGENSIRVEDWLVIKKIIEKNISAGFVSIDRDEESKAIKSYQRECFTEFERLGVPAVKALSKNGELSKGIKHTYANEWLSSKEESREKNRDNRDIESLVIARKSKNIAIWSIIISIISIIITLSVAIFQSG